MRYSLAYVAAAVGSASAAYMPGGYGGGNGGYGDGGYGDTTTQSIPSATAYPVPSSSSGGVYPYDSETPSYYPTGTAPSYSHSSASGYSPYSPSNSPSGYTQSYPTGTAPYSYSPSGYGPSQSYPTGTAPNYPISSSTGNSPYGPSGSVTYSHPSPYPTGTGTSPYGSGTVTPSVPVTTPYSPTTVTHSTGTGTSTYTVTHTGTTTATKTITEFVPCSTPVGTASGKTYYSTYLTTSVHTSTVTAVTTEVEVICPATSAPYGPESTPTNSPYGNEHNNGGYGSPESTPTNSPYGNEHNNAGSGSGSESSGYGAIPTSSLYAGHPSPDYPASTTYGPSHAPTAGTCAPSETTVYSTMVVTKTVGAETIPTECADCSTYHITLPNGYPTSVVVPPAGGKPTNAPYPYNPGHSGLPHYPIGSGTAPVYGPGPTGTGSVAPSGTAAYGGYSYDYKL